MSRLSDVRPGLGLRAKRRLNLGLGNPGESGVALVFVLAALVFLTVLSLAFLASMRSKMMVSKAGADGSAVRLLSDTAVNLVISQVQDATMLAGADNSLAWASQPGMIRLYDSQGEAAGYRKLYSWENMAGEGAFKPSDAQEQVPGDWESHPETFTDLNAPAGGVYPILDYSRAKNDLNVEGISLGDVPGGSAENPAPMPVKWLYVLADGTLHPPGAGSTGTKAVIPAATKENPIIGRIAFWADDETAKVNINTAAGGAFWATPRFDGVYEREGLARSQPVSGEFQRYPGHPAGVSLKTVFGNLSDDEVYELAPRISQGGSQGGTVPLSDVTSPVVPDRDRLYASVDELIFKNPIAGAPPERVLQNSKITKEDLSAARFFLSANSRAPELTLSGQPRIATWPLHQIDNADYRTADDRLIAFCSSIGRNDPENGQQPYPFYFTRQNPMDPEGDIGLLRNRNLLNYLDLVTGEEVPGFGDSFRAKYSQPEMRQILTQIYDYIRCTNLFDRTTTHSSGVARPDFPYAFAINSRVFHVNPEAAQNRKGRTDAYTTSAGLGSAVPAKHATWKTMGFGGRQMQVMEAHLHFIGMGQGKQTQNSPSTPAVPINSKQVGSRVGMDPADPTGNTPKDDDTAVQAYLSFSFLTPGEGVEWWHPAQWIEVEGLDSFGIKHSPSAEAYTPMGFPAQGQMLLWGNMLGGGTASSSGIVNFLSPFAMTYGANRPKTIDGANLSSTYNLNGKGYHFPFYSAIVPISTTAGTMAFSGGEIRVKIYADHPHQPAAQPYSPPTGARYLIQTLTIRFPAASFPVPLCNPAGIRRFGSLNGAHFSIPEPHIGRGTAEARSNQIAANTIDRWWVTRGEEMVDAAHDVIRSVGVASGDVRLLFTEAPPGTLFAPLEDYTNLSKRICHSVTGWFGNSQSVGSRGALIRDAGTPTTTLAAPFVPSHVNGVFTQSGALGDWDNGTANHADGPFINAADHGSMDILKDTAGFQGYFGGSEATEAHPGNALAQSLTTSPNRQIPSPVMFGSLPTGVHRGMPWQTLLFRPGPPNHPGSAHPRDHLLLDLFWMPVVKPYAISEPFSTAGKINLNQQIVPFTYINRLTGLHAVLSPERIAKMPKSTAGGYKTDPNLDQPRLPINLSEEDGALRQFREKFANDELFRSATEICDIYLPPAGTSWPSDDDAQAGWYGDDFALVGDNTRERPYVNLYNRITTKSNTFTVHYRVQTLRQTPARLRSDPSLFDSSDGDHISAEQRGSASFERYIDSADPRLATPTPATPEFYFLRMTTAAPGFTRASFERFYRVRITNTKVFNP